MSLLYIAAAIAVLIGAQTLRSKLRRSAQCGDDLAPSDENHPQRRDRRPVDFRLQDAKPCPFCGSTLLFFPRHENSVHCDTCEMDGPMVTIEMDNPERTWRRALAKWNSRWQSPERSSIGRGAAAIERDVQGS